MRRPTGCSPSGGGDDSSWGLLYRTTRANNALSEKSERGSTDGQLCVCQWYISLAKEASLQKSGEAKPRERQYIQSQGLQVNSAQAVFRTSSIILSYGPLLCLMTHPVVIDHVCLFMTVIALRSSAKQVYLGAVLSMFAKPPSGATSSSGIHEAYIAALFE